MRALDLDPESPVAQWHLRSLRRTFGVRAVAMAVASSDWPAAREALQQLRSSPRAEPGWPADRSFSTGVVVPALRAQQGQWLLTTLRDLDFEAIAAPLVLAIEALVDDQAERLNEVEPELRMAAQTLYKELGAALAGAGSPRPLAPPKPGDEPMNGR